MLFLFVVLSRIHKLIGCFAKDYPDCIKDGDGMKIRDMYFKALEKAIITQQDVIVQLIDSIRMMKFDVINFSSFFRLLWFL